MSITHWAAAAVLLALPLVAGAGVTRQAVRGNLTATAQDGDEVGRFRILVGDRSNGAHFERIEAATKRLDPAVEYHLFLVSSDASAAADFGTVNVGPHGFGGFRFDTRFTALPSGVTTVADFGGGTVEIRDGSTAVLTGTVPAFGSGEPGSATVGHDRQRLVAVDVSFAGRGEILARRQDLPSGVREEVRVTCGRMESGATYSVVVIAADSSETSLGSFTTSSPLGLGGLRLSTKHGDTISGGGVLGLAGLAVEIRDSSDVAVLAGTFPTLVQ